MFPTIEYLEWITGRPDAAEHDLGSSDLRGVDARRDDIVPTALDGLSSPPDDVNLESQLADAYGVDETWVHVTPGASNANVLAVAAALDESRLESAGDDGSGSSEPTPRVLVEKPGYEPLVETPRAFGAEVDRFMRDTADNYALDPARVDAAVMPETALVTVTNRHNPSGRMAAREAVSNAASVAAAVDARLLVDEVYAPYTLVPGAGPFGGETSAGERNVVVTGSLTKFFGLGGLRIGWVVADPAFVDRVRSIAYHFPALASPSVELGRRALSGADRLAEDSRALLARNHALLTEFVDDRADLVGPVYEGSTFAFLNHESASGDEVAARAWEEGLLVVPGRFFDDDARFRISLGCDPEHVARALSVLGSVLDEL